MKENAVVTTTSSHNKTTATATPDQFIIPLYPDYTLAVKIVDVFFCTWIWTPSNIFCFEKYFYMWCVAAGCWAELEIVSYQYAEYN